MLFQSNKINAETVLPFPGRARTAAAKPSIAEPSTAKSLLPVLIILHQETSTPGRVGNALRALGHKMDIRRPRFGDSLPETLDGHAGRGDFRRPDEREQPR
jgi:GMP synthase (glutamine-hydrolysing)